MCSATRTTARTLSDEAAAGNLVVVADSERSTDRIRKVKERLVDHRTRGSEKWWLRKGFIMISFRSLIAEKRDIQQEVIYCCCRLPTYYYQIYLLKLTEHQKWTLILTSCLAWGKYVHIEYDYLPKTDHVRHGLSVSTQSRRRPAFYLSSSVLDHMTTYF